MSFPSRAPRHPTYDFPTLISKLMIFYPVRAGILGKVWEMSDLDGDHRLNPVEFAIGMHLIVCIRSDPPPNPYRCHNMHPPLS
jgi:hypothetical protein